MKSFKTYVEQKKKRNKLKFVLGGCNCCGGKSEKSSEKPEEKDNIEIVSEPVTDSE